MIGPDTVCAVDGRPGTAADPLQLDHILPLSLGGTDDPWNLRAIHRSENISRGGRNRLRRSR
ncbi:MAG: HNH endonuclease signature motif containing protein [bacterium]